VRPVLPAVLLFLGFAPAAQAAPFSVGTGQNAGVAVDDAGTTYVGWQVNTNRLGDAAQLCVLPPRSTRCASSVTVAFPGNGYNRSRVSVLLPAPNVVDVIMPRTNLGGAFTYLARSTDGGRTFGPARRIAGEGFEQGVQGPGGRVALVTGLTLQAGLFSPSGADAGAEGSSFGGVPDAQFNDIAASGDDVLVAGSYTGTSHAFRLPAGADPNEPGAWQQTADPAPGGRQPELAGIPGGFAAMLEPASATARSLFVQRLEGANWSPPVAVAPVSNNDFRLLGNAKGRLTALVTDSLPYRLSYTTSTDGGVLWSSLVTIALYGKFVEALEGGMASDGRGAAAVDYEFDDKSVRVARFSPATAPVARRRFGGARVQVRSVCDGEKLSLVVEAARGNRRVAPQTVLRRARFGRARGARRGFRTRFRASYQLRRPHARIPVRVLPRRGRARTMRLRVRRCSATH
jgi:hypothetical protein